MSAASSASRMNSPRPGISAQYQSSYGASGTLFPRRRCADRKRVDAFAHQVTERPVDRPLPLEPAQSGEARRLDLDREMALAAAVVAGVAVMLCAVVDHLQSAGSERFAEAFLDFVGDRSGESLGHLAYIKEASRKGS